MLERIADQLLAGRITCADARRMLELPVPGACWVLDMLERG
jgi:hypothetical protein